MSVWTRELPPVSSALPEARIPSPVKSRYRHVGNPDSQVTIRPFLRPYPFLRTKDTFHNPTQANRGEIWPTDDSLREPREDIDDVGLFALAANVRAISKGLCLRAHY